MRVTRYSFMGLREPDLDKVELSATERNTLCRASVILDKLRLLRNGGDLDADDELNTDIAIAAHACRELTDGEIFLR